MSTHAEKPAATNGRTPPVVLSIAGFDPTSGAGVSADIKTFAANQVYGVACIACQTVQNTCGVTAYQPTDAALLQAQLDHLLTDLRPAAVKIGMLGSAAAVEVVAGAIEHHALANLVLDPVAAASQGVELMDAAGWEVLRTRLFPLVDVLTPNLPEAARLTGLEIAKPADMQRAAERLLAMGPKAIIVKGGHLDRPVDVLYDGSSFVTLTADRIRTANTHGTGCTFSAALAANLATGKRLLDAVILAKAYLAAALKQSYPVGHGPGPLNHLYRLQEAPTSRNIDPAPQIEYTTR